MKITCVVPSAGRGKRLKKRESKAFIKIKRKPLIFYTISALEKCSLIDEIIIVVSPEKIAPCRNLVRNNGFGKVTGIIAGGEHRFDSVKKGLRKVKDADLVLIHDGARPFIDEAVVNRVVSAVKKYGAALAAVAAKQTLKVVGKYFFIQKTPDRKSLWEAQTPQGFMADLIKKAYARSGDRGATDDSLLVERLGRKVKVVKGSYRNIKITTPEDLELARLLIKHKE